jgi:hypothetical protein
MAQQHAGAEREERSGNDNRVRKATPPITRAAPIEEKKVSFRDRWSATQASKTAIFWLLIVVIALTMLVGFNWGGWVTGGTAQKTATTTAQAAVVARLAPICVAQFNADPQKDAKLVELQGTSNFQRSAFVKTHGWATMPGESAPDNKVAEACAKLLMGE